MLTRIETYELAMEIIDADPSLDFNVELKEAELMVAGKWPDRVDMPKLWRNWILERRQGTKDITFYGRSGYEMFLHDNVGSIFVKDPTYTVKLVSHG